MTILFVTHYSGFYGANKSLLKLMVLLRDKYGVNPIVLLPSAGQMCDELDRAGIPYYVSHYYWWVNYDKGVFHYFLNKRKQFRNLFRIKKLCKLFDDFSIDLVYSNSSTINIGLFIAERLGVSHIWQFRESLSQYNLSLPRFLSKAIWEMTSNKCYIMISDYMMEYNRRFLPEERMIRVYNGVDVDKTPIEKNRGNSSAINLCCVGVICKQKNQRDAVSALAILRKKGYNVILHLVGTSQDEYSNKLVAQITSLGLEEHVIFHGHQDDVFSILSLMDIGLTPSIDEAFGRTTIEYMLSEMPVVASNSGANKELVKDGFNGYLYLLGDARDLAEKVEQLLKSPSSIVSMGQQGRKYAEENFTAEKNAEQIYNVIKGVLFN